MMKLVSFNIFVLLTIVILYFPSGVFAIEATTSPSEIRQSIKERLQNRVEMIQDKISGRKEKVAEITEKSKEARIKMVRRSVEARRNHFIRMADRLENLLKKLEERITKAKTAGKDTTESEVLLNNARNRLIGIKTKLHDIGTLEDTASTKESFQQIHKSFKEIRDEIKAIRNDLADIIRNLKGFNSATTSGQNLQAEGTSPASAAD